MDDCVLITKEEIQKILKTKPLNGKNSLEPFKSFALENHLPLSILEDNQVSNKVDLHRKDGDLWLCLEGDVDFVYGGKTVNEEDLKNPDGSVNSDELQAQSIRGGKKVTLKPGDWLWIPPGQPHQHSCSGIARLIIIKIPAQNSL